MKFIRSQEGVLDVEVDSGLALLDVKSNTYFLLNQTGAVLWAELAHEKSLDELCRIIEYKFDVSAERCEADVQEIVEVLVQKGWVGSSHENPG